MDIARLFSSQIRSGSRYADFWVVLRVMSGHVLCIIVGN